MDVANRLACFERVELSPDQAGLDTSFADGFLKAFTRVAKSQVKMQQAVELSVEDVRRALKEQSDLIEDIQGRRRAAERTNEQLVRFVMEVVDIIINLERAASEGDNPELRSIADTMMDALRSHMQEVGLALIPAMGSIPDSLYHFVLSTRQVSDAKKGGRVVEVVKPGYTFRGEVVRKAEVIVGQ